MADNYLSGTTGHVLLGATEYSFGKWRLDMETAVPKVTNFTSGGFQALVSGITKGTITLEGPYNQGNMPLTCGNSYSFVLKWTASVSITVTALITKLSIDDDAEAAPRVNVTAESNGTFTAAIT